MVQESFGYADSGRGRQVEAHSRWRDALNGFDQRFACRYLLPSGGMLLTQCADGLALTSIDVSGGSGESENASAGGKKLLK